MPGLTSANLHSERRPDAAWRQKGADAGAAPEKKPGLLIAVALVSSLIASTCCVLPLALVLLGITGAWMVHLASFAPATPIFIAVAVAALGWAGYLVFKPSASCAPAQGAACGRNRRAMKALYLACAAFIALLLLFPLFAPLFY